MASKKGRLTICDRCGAMTFSEYIGQGEADGGYTTWERFNPTPDGWDYVTVNDKRMNLCPACMDELKACHNDFLNKATVRDGYRTAYVLVDEMQSNITKREAKT